MIFFVHTGKTGGTEVKRRVRAHFGVPKLKEPQVIGDKIVLLNHSSLKEAIGRFGDPSGLIITYREPAERFVSGFYCRQRMGLPNHRAIWDAREAAAFAHFRSANELAEALTDEDPIRVAAAHFAFMGIRHLRKGYVYHFGNLVNFALDYAEKITMCVETKNLDLRMPQLLKAVAPDFPNTEEVAERASSVHYDKNISALALKNIQSAWQEEYDYYEFFKQLEGSISADGSNDRQTD